MYQINFHKNQVVLQSAESKSQAIINLEQGGRLEKLKIDDHIVIQEPHNLPYEDGFASAILFPFANRIAGGRYHFKSQNYRLTTNEKGGNNAIHGLIYNKTFQVESHQTSEAGAALTLIYNENKPTSGFPFCYRIILTYNLSSGSLSLNVNVVNTGDEAFPFTLGWHPYFYSTHLAESELRFDPEYQIEFDEHLITKGKTSAEIQQPFFIKDNILDDCFLLKNPEVKLKTNHHQISLTSNPFHPYLQVYTPPARDSIAIEPMTGISDSFNNKIGLQILKINEVYEQEWIVEYQE